MFRQRGREDDRAAWNIPAALPSSQSSQISDVLPNLVFNVQITNELSGKRRFKMSRLSFTRLTSSRVAGKWYLAHRSSNADGMTGRGLMGQEAPRNRGCHRPLQTLRRATAACKWDTGNKHEGLQQANVQDAGDTLSLGEASLQRVPPGPRALRLPRCVPGQTCL